MFNRKNWFKVITICTLAIVCTLYTNQPASAQGYNNQGSHKIADDSMPWKGWPWLVGALFSAGTLAVGFKNAKRTHLD